MFHLNEKMSLQAANNVSTEVAKEGNRTTFFNAVQTIKR
jgi:hypothetical protein